MLKKLKINEYNFTHKVSTIDKDVLDFYDEYASSWDKRFQNTIFLKHFLKNRFQQSMLFVDESENKNLLELGVGTGIYIKELSKKFKYIHAVDGSSNMIKELNLKIKKQKIKNVKTFVGNVCNLHFLKKNKYDYIIFYGLIEHVIHRKKFEKEIFRLLKRGGKVIGVTPNGLSPWYYFKKITRGQRFHCSSDKLLTETSLKKIFSNKKYIAKINLFGAVPPSSLNNKIIFYILLFLEQVLILKPFSILLGAICFSAKKR